MIGFLSMNVSKLVHKLTKI